MAPLDMIGLPPVSDDAPAGENLELDPEFGDSSAPRRASRKPVRQHDRAGGAARLERDGLASPKRCIERTHDLRVLVAPGDRAAAPDGPARLRRRSCA